MCHHHHSQPSMLHRRMKAYLLLDHSPRSSAISTQLLPIYLTKSAVQRVFDLPLILLPLGFHFIIPNVRLFLAIDAWPAHFHFNVLIICKAYGRLAFVLLQCRLFCPSNLSLASFIPRRVEWTWSLTPLLHVSAAYSNMEGGSHFA